MKKLIILCVLLLFTITLISATIDPAIEHKFNNGEKTVKVVIEENQPLDNPSPTQTFYSLSRRDNILDNLNKTKILSKGFVANITEEEYNSIKYNPQITVREPITFKAFLQDSVSIINATNSWNLLQNDLNLTGLGQTICVLDTGVNASHPDLVGEILTEKCWCDNSGGCCPGGGTEENNASDGHGHGTHVSGIITANGGTKGIAPDSKVIAVKVLSDSNVGNDVDLTSAVQWCVDNAETYNITVISASLGADCSLYPNLCYDTRCSSLTPSLQTQINAATTKNISVVIASGNDNNKTHISWPACLPNVTIISATTKVDAIASYANINSLVKLVAPGSSINSTLSDPSSCPAGCSCTGLYSICSGTSMSTPMIAGTISILKQFLNLTTQYKTPSEVETIFYNTGKNITYSSINYSRINIYDAIISLDAISPNVTLITPENNSISSNTNQTFTINITDLQLKNLTFFLWNSTSLINQTSTNQTGQNTEYQINMTNLPLSEKYYWTLQAYDQNNNTYIANNYTLTIGETSTTINSPTNNTFTNQNATNFSCTSQSLPSQQLSNITFYIFNSTSLVYNTTTNITGTTNTTTFNYTLPTETNYSWNCKTLNNISNSSQTDNYTITYETLNPNLTIISSPTSVTSNSIDKIFHFNISDNYENANCSLLFNNVINTSKIITNYTITNNFTRTLTPKTYNWKINCTDQAENSNISAQNSFTITAEAITTSSNTGGGGGGGSTTTPINGTINNPISSSQIKTGYTKTYKKKEKIYFTLRVENHSLTINNINESKINITIKSTPIIIIMQENTTQKFNLTTPEYLDLLVEVGKITLTNAEITIKEIQERNPDYKPLIFHGVNATPDTTTTKQQIISKEIRNNLLIIIASVVVIIIAIIIFIILLIKPKKESTAKKLKNISKQIKTNK